MQLKKHNFKTPPERKPKWLRKGIALLAAVATLATGGVVASTAYAGGGGGNQQAGPGGTPSRDRDVWWNYKDQALSNPSDPTSGSFGSAATDAPVYAAFNEAGITVDNVGPTKITDARTQAYNECKDGFHARHPGEGDGDCRVVAVGAMLGDHTYHGSSWEESKASHWVSLWNDYIKPRSFKYAGTVTYGVDTPFYDEPSMSVQGIMNARVCKDANYCPADDNKAIIDRLSIVVIVLDKYQPAAPIQKFTPTISTSAPHVIQEGQSITDNVTVDAKQGDTWPKDEHGNNVSITAKGYYFIGPKDDILKGVSPSGGINSDADIASHPGRVGSGGEYPWVAGMGVRYGLFGRDPARGRVMATQTLQGQGEGRAVGTPLRAFCLSPVELGLVCGQDGFVVFFRSVGQEDRRLSHAESHLVQGQQYPGSLASEVFPADKQDRRVRLCGLDHSFILVEVGYAGVLQQFPQGRNTRLRGSCLRVFDGPQLAEE